MIDKIYENVEKLKIDIPIVDNQGYEVPISTMISQRFYVLYPGDLKEYTWEVIKEEPNILRHTVPEDAKLYPGIYKIQPYIETVDGYKGRAATVELRITKNYK